MSGRVRIQRQRVKGWRMPPGAVYVGRPSLFGNPWTLEDCRGWDVPVAERREWLVAQYRKELDAGGLLSDWGGIVSEARWEEMSRLMDALPQERDHRGYLSVRPLFRHLLTGATALACWCPLDQPCHADVLLELLA